VGGVFGTHHRQPILHWQSNLGSSKHYQARAGNSDRALSVGSGLPAFEEILTAQKARAGVGQPLLVKIS